MSGQDSPAGPTPPPVPVMEGPPQQRIPLKGCLVVVIVAVVLLVALLVVMTLKQGPRIENDEGEIENASAFLDDVQESWRSELPSSEIEIHDEAACFYVIDSDELITGEIACGGVRRVGTSSAEVWDVFAFTVVEESGEQTAVDFVLDRTGAKKPAGDLVDADGQDPPDGVDEVDEPPLPQADAGLVLEELPEGTTVEDVTDPGDAGIVQTPVGTITINSVATAPALSLEDDSPEGRSLRGPADDHVFRVIDFEWSASEDPDEASVELVLSADGQQRQIVQVAENDGWGSEDSSHRMVISAPAEGAELLITSDGHGQVVDLATGERQSDPIADTYYRKVRSQDLNEEWTFPTKTVDDYAVDLNVSLSTVSLTPHVPRSVGREGWAKADQAWLVVRFESSVDIECCSRFSVKTTSYDVVVRSGKKVVGRASVKGDSYDDEFAVPVSVPVDALAKVQIEMVPTVVLKIFDGPDKTLTYDAKRRQTTFAK